MKKEKQQQCETKGSYQRKIKLKCKQDNKLCAKTTMSKTKKKKCFFYYSIRTKLVV